MATGEDITGPPRLPQTAESRAQQLQLGASGDPDNTATVAAQPDAGLTADSLQFRAMTPRGYRPSSVLTPIGSDNNPGGLGMSAGDAARRLPDGTYVGSINGQSESSFEPSALLKMQSGLDSE